MSKPKLYFGPDAEEGCYPLSWHLEGAENEDTITLQLAMTHKERGYAWCFHFDVMLDLNEEPCGRLCPAYAPRNGRSGCCKHFTRTFYEPGERVVFDVKTGKPLKP